MDTLEYTMGLAKTSQVLGRLDMIATWFHTCFTTSVNGNDNPWGFTKENWKVGPVTDRDSATFFLYQLAQWGAHFHEVRRGDELAGLAVTVMLQPEILADPRYQLEQWGALAGDLYFAVYCVDPRHRGAKLASRLIDQTVLHGRRLPTKPRRFFVRTHAGHEDRVIHSFRERGPDIVGRYEVPQFGNVTPRVVMAADFEQMRTLAEVNA